MTDQDNPTAGTSLASGEITPQQVKTHTVITQVEIEGEYPGPGYFGYSFTKEEASVCLEMAALCRKSGTNVVQVEIEPNGSGEWFDQKFISEEGTETHTAYEDSVSFEENLIVDDRDISVKVVDLRNNKELCLRVMVAHEELAEAFGLPLPWETREFAVREALGAPRTGETEELYRYGDALQNFASHRSNWRAALVIARDTAEVRPPDIDDAGYWAHQIRAFDRVAAVLAPDHASSEAPSEVPAPAPSGTAPRARVRP